MLIELQNINKDYSGKKVLNGISLSFSSGTINALLGENGAGKSTLASILCGDIKPSSGSILIDRSKCSFDSAKDAISKGIILVHQKPLLASSISVKENILLFSENDAGNISLTKAFKRIDGKLNALRQQWAPSLDLNCIIKDAGGDCRFYTALLGALLREPSCLILDEPAALLNADQRDALYANLEKLCASGVTVIVITHSSSEAARYARSVTLLKDGVLFRQFADGYEYGEWVKEEQKSGFIPKQGASLTDITNTSAKKGTCLDVRNISAFPKNKCAVFNADIKTDFSSITVVKSGSDGALSTIEDIVTGMADFDYKGSVLYEGNSVRKYDSVFLRSVKAALIPEDKNIRASNSNLSVEQMLSVYNLNCPSKEINLLAQKIIEKANVNIKPEQKVSSLSGGMLQRLIIERELSLNGDLIILSHPLQALDFAAQNELCRRLISLKENGKAILIIGGDDFPLSYCDRVYAVEDGKTRPVYVSEEVQQ